MSTRQPFTKDLEFKLVQVPLSPSIFLTTAINELKVPGQGQAYKYAVGLNRLVSSKPSP